MKKIIFPPTIAPDFVSYVKSFERNMQARNLSPRTIETYLEALLVFSQYIADNGMPQDVTVMSREHIEQILLWQIQERKPNTAMTRYKSLNVFFNWLVEEGEISDSPMKRIKPPKVPENPPEVLTIEQLQLILKTCSAVCQLLCKIIESGCSCDAPSIVSL